MNVPDFNFLILDVDGTLTDGGVYITADGVESKKFNVRDGLGILNALKKGLKIGVISASKNSAIVDYRVKMLGIPYYYVGERKKIGVLKEWLSKLKITPEQVAYIGDDINDLDIMNYVGFSACPANAVDEIKEISDVVLLQKGGEGCVREFIDRFVV